MLAKHRTTEKHLNKEKSANGWVGPKLRGTIYR